MQTRFDVLTINKYSYEEHTWKGQLGCKSHGIGWTELVIRKIGDRQTVCLTDCELAKCLITMRLGDDRSCNCNNITVYEKNISLEQDEYF